MMKPIYLDYAATTPVDVRVAKKMSDYLTSEGAFGNPASLHVYGTQAREAVENARDQVANLLNAHPSEIIWTSGATESNNLALKGAVELYQRKGKHIITMKTEHKAVLDPLQHLEKEGYSVTYLSPNKNGILDLDLLQETLRDDTILISIMYVNNETGVIQPIAKIAEITSAKGILLHVDAAQAPGKTEINLQQTPVDLLSISAHKVYGPKGIGALYLRKKPRVRVSPLLHGGGHEQGMRSGTLATHQIVGMGEAFYLAQHELHQDLMHIQQLRNHFLKIIMIIPQIALNVSLENTVPHILNLRFEGMIANALLAQLPMIATSTASACQSKGIEGSHVLRALQFTDASTKSSVRFSFGRMTTMQEVDDAARMIKKLFSE